MEPQIWLPAAAALAGALIGSIAPVVVGLLNAHAEARRERLRLAVQLAIEEHQRMMELAKHRLSTGKSTDIAPLSAILGYHAQLLERLQDVDSLTDADFELIRNRAKKAFHALAGTPGGEE